MSSMGMCDIPTREDFIFILACVSTLEVLYQENLNFLPVLTSDQCIRYHYTCEYSGFYLPRDIPVGRG